MPYPIGSSNITFVTSWLEFTSILSPKPSTKKLILHFFWHSWPIIFHWDNNHIILRPGRYMHVRDRWICINEFPIKLILTKTTAHRSDFVYLRQYLWRFQLQDKRTSGDRPTEKRVLRYLSFSVWFGNPLELYYWLSEAGRVQRLSAFESFSTGQPFLGLLSERSMLEFPWIMLRLFFKSCDMISSRGSVFQRGLSPLPPASFNGPDNKPLY